tara:strand:- start:875 stop:1051 length:177 start_codon:yes stop_codon:yes gene_type:complete
MSKQKQGIDWRVISIGLICLTILECYALSQGINGTLLKIVLVVIAGVIGVTIPNPLKK